MLLSAGLALVLYCDCVAYPVQYDRPAAGVRKSRSPNSLPSAYKGMIFAADRAILSVIALFCEKFFAVITLLPASAHRRLICYTVSAHRGQ